MINTNLFHNISVLKNLATQNPFSTANSNQFGGAI